MSRLNQLPVAHSLQQFLAAERDPRARRRLGVILASQSGELTAAQIAERFEIARSTVFAYRRLYAEHGVAGLLAHTRAGRPATPVTPALEKVIMSGLRLLSFFNVPALQRWIAHYDRFYPPWTVRRWALAFIKRLRIRFAKDWRKERMNAYQEWRRSLNPAADPCSRWWRERLRRESAQPTLDLVVEPAAGVA